MTQKTTEFKSQNLQENDIVQNKRIHQKLARSQKKGTTSAVSWCSPNFSVLAEVCDPWMEVDEFHSTFGF
jgi:hypothetical protein